MSFEPSGISDNLNSSDDIIYKHFDTILRMYDDMIEEAKTMNGDLLSNDYIYLKPVFQEFFELFQFSFQIKDQNKHKTIKDYSDDEQDGTDKTVNFKEANFLSFHSNDPDDQSMNLLVKKEPSGVKGKTGFVKKDLGQDYDYGLGVERLDVEDPNEDSKEIENFKETTFSSVH